jgi:hypothetical protein
MIEENIALSEKYAKKAIEIDENNFQAILISTKTKKTKNNIAPPIIFLSLY